MNKTIAIGIQDFEELIQKNYFYIDKTEFIKEWWESGDSVTLITRPRRFGKTLNMSMLEKFFSMEYANRVDLFHNLSIWKYEQYQQIQGTYPVISLSFANIKESNYSTTREKICFLLKKLYVKYAFIRESNRMTSTDKTFFDKILSGTMSDSEATMALHELSDFLYHYYGKKVIILLDEYDTPMQEAYVNGFWEELVAFTRSFFNATFKTNPYLERGIMTGITRVSKESIFSDLNHLKVVTTTSDEYATAFGFTEEEVFLALEEFSLETEKQGVKEWYDGFIFGTCRDIYNPWSVLNFLDTRKYDIYWANTSGNRLIGTLLREGDVGIKELFEDLLKGNVIRCPIEEQIVYSDLDNGEDAICSLLLASGYLKVLSYERAELIGEAEVMYDLVLTNYEVKRMFLRMVRGWFSTVKRVYNDFVKAMLVGNVKEMNHYMNRVTLETFSYFDTGKRVSGLESERFYHGFVLGLIADLSKEYVITSNRESGYGRYDVMIEPKERGKKAVILEFKVHDKEEEASLQDTIKKALEQIEERQYETILIAKGFRKEEIYRYGFAFEGKKVLIGM